MALTTAEIARRLRQRRQAAQQGRMALPPRDPRTPTRIANPEQAAFRHTGAGFDMPTIDNTPAWLRPAPARQRDTGEDLRSRQPAAARPPRARRTPPANPAAAAVTRSTPAASAPRSTYSPPSGSSAPAPAATTAPAARPAAPKPGTLRAKAAKSDAEFAGFDAKTRAAALRDFKETHAWARDGDQDEVKKAVAYLLSKEKGRFGSQRYSDGAPVADAQRSADRRRNALAGSAPDAPPAAAANPAVAAIEGGMTPAQLDAYRRRYNIPRSEWSDDGSSELLDVRQRREATRDIREARAAEKAWRKRNPGKRPPSFGEFR